MTVEIRFDKASTPIIYSDVVSTYQKGSLFCIRLSDGSTIKYPLENIFDIREK